MPAAPSVQPEPWLRGPLPDVHPLFQPVFFSFAQVREDLANHTAGLTERQFAKSSLSFQLKHLAGSVDRITTYLLGSPLSAEQLTFLRQEARSGERLPDLLEAVERSLADSERRILTIDPASLYAARTVGRRALPTTVIGLIVHLAEHTQRHLGQAILLAQIARQSNP